MNKVFNEDCIETIKRLQDASVDLVVTSPPYEAMKDYGKNVSNRAEEEWVEWLVSIFTALKPKLKETSSIIINVNAPVKNKCRSLAPQRLQVALSDIFCHYDCYIWTKKCGIPSASPKRLDNKHEYIFHFTKSNSPKMYADRVKEKKSEGALKRQEYSVQYPVDVVDDKGVVTSVAQNKMVEGDMRYPFSYLFFPNASALRDTPQSKHPAPYHPALPEFFIKLLTDEGDIVYDPFSGSGTTLMVAKKLGRQYVGSELNPAYIPLIEESLNNV